jgi:RHS repeat-associated protein
MASEHPHVANQHVGPVFQVRSLPSRYLKLGARYYNPTTARFTQPDPSALYGAYANANDNPTNNTDPTGLFCQGFQQCTADGAAVGAFTGIVVYGLVAIFGTDTVTLPVAVPLGAEQGGSTGAVIGGSIGIGQDVVSFFRSL